MIVQICGVVYSSGTTPVHYHNKTWMEEYITATRITCYQYVIHTHRYAGDSNNYRYYELLYSREYPR